MMMMRRRRRRIIVRRKCSGRIPIDVDDIDDGLSIQLEKLTPRREKTNIRCNKIRIKMK